MTIPKFNAAIVSIVKYPSKKPVTNGEFTYVPVASPYEPKGLNTEPITITNIKVNNVGVNTFPIRSTNLFGDNESQYATEKNIKVNIKRAMVSDIWLGRYGDTTISNGKLPALGIPKQGPIDK